MSIQHCPTCDDILPHHRAGCTQPICAECGEPLELEGRHHVPLGELVMLRCDPTRRARHRKRVADHEAALPPRDRSEALPNPELSKLDWW